MRIKIGEHRMVTEEFVQDEIRFRPGDTFIIRGTDTYNYACELPNERTSYLHSCNSLTKSYRGWWIRQSKVERCTIPYTNEPDWRI